MQYSCHKYPMFRELDYKVNQYKSVVQTHLEVAVESYNSDQYDGVV